MSNVRKMINKICTNYNYITNNKILYRVVYNSKTNIYVFHQNIYKDRIGYFDLINLDDHNL